MDFESNYQGKSHGRYKRTVLKLIFESVNFKIIFDDIILEQIFVFSNSDCASFSRLFNQGGYSK